MSLLRSIRALIAVAIFATILAAFQPFALPVVSDDGGNPMRSMACGTCNHMDMSLAECTRTGCPVIVKVAELDRFLKDAVAVRFAQEPVHQLNEWQIVPTVPPG